MHDDGTLRRCVVELYAGIGARRSISRWRDGELGGDVRRRLLGPTASKSISSSWSSSPRASSLANMPFCSIDCINSSPSSPSWVTAGLDWLPSSMLSTRSNFLRGFVRGVTAARVSVHDVLILSSPSSVLTAGREGVTTKRFAGVNFMNLYSAF